MDGGRPFRAPQPAERKPVTRSEPVYRPEEPAPIEEQPRSSSRASSHRANKEKKSPKKFFVTIIAVVVIIVLGLVGWLVFANKNSATAIDSGKYQAVFFTNGQVYFGKLHEFNDGYMKLTDIFYLQAQESEQNDSENPQQSSTDSNNVQLIKLGSEIHGPEDAMILSKDQVLFYENLKADGKVAQSIEQYKKSKQ